MFIVTVKTHCGYEKEYKIIEPNYAYFYFKSFIQASDVEYVVITDGLTGEVLAEYENGKITLYN